MIYKYRIANIEFLKIRERKKLNEEIIFISTLSFAQAVYRGNLNDNGDGTLGQENISFDEITTIYYNLKKHTK